MRSAPIIVVRLAEWYWPHVEDGSYYGYRWGFAVGPVLILVWPCDD